jgi:hypothetical protein
MSPQSPPALGQTVTTTPGWLLGAAWLAVSLPLAWGVAETLAKVVALFN